MPNAYNSDPFVVARAAQISLFLLLWLFGFRSRLAQWPEKPGLLSTKSVTGLESLRVMVISPVVANTSVGGK